LTKKFKVDTKLLKENICFGADSLETDKSNIHFSNVDISFSINGKIIRSEKLRVCLVKKESDTLKILFTNGGLIGNNIIINCYGDYFESYIELWSDYKEFNGEYSLKLPLKKSSLLLNTEVFEIGDNLKGVFKCNSILETEYFNGKAKVDCNGCFSSLIKKKWE
jgi:hypothetical protein